MTLVPSFDIAVLRDELHLSQEGFGALIGVNGKGRMSLIERGEAIATVPQAIAIETLSIDPATGEPRIDAATLNADVAAARAALASGRGLDGLRLATFAAGDNRTGADDLPTGPVPELRIVTCFLCDKRIDMPDTLACAATDCPHSVKVAA